MFNRRTYKKLAKSQLKGRRFVPAIATLITIAILALISGPETYSKNFSEGKNPYLQNVDFIEEDFPNGMNFFWEKNFSAYSDSSDLIFSIIMVCILGILNLALCHLYNEYFKDAGKIPLSRWLQGFSYWFKGALSMLWYSLWIFLWSLLFFIPGLVKAFSYSQMFFIIAENPKISVAKAMRLSKVMTKGFKADLFVMYLSFILWDFLSVCTGGILVLWVHPYKKLSFLNAYKDLKIHAIRAGLLSPEDFR
ncbi:DUF975 family protein [Treponema pectinovorum]|uniref:DUF975 family protein n=1 Tax=Treponema pectinovorum TaxID=164 RepID=UPI0011F36F59|nr:DUF975 family protein [Treponema pectinovorum]